MLLGLKGSNISASPNLGPYSDRYVIRLRPLNTHLLLASSHSVDQRFQDSSHRNRHHLHSLALLRDRL